jgi:hypothetical protein
MDEIDYTKNDYLIPDQNHPSKEKFMVILYGGVWMF